MVEAVGIETAGRELGPSRLSFGEDLIPEVFLRSGLPREAAGQSDNGDVFHGGRLRWHCGRGVKRMVCLEWKVRCWYQESNEIWEVSTVRGIGYKTRITEGEEGMGNTTGLELNNRVTGA